MDVMHGIQHAGLMVVLSVLLASGTSGCLTTEQKGDGRGGHGDGPPAACESNADCPKGFTCYSRPPYGPHEGIPGTKERPGRCYDDNVLRKIY